MFFVEEVTILLSALGIYKATSWGYRVSDQKAQLLPVHQGWMWPRVFPNLKASTFTSVLSKATGFFFPEVMGDFLQLLCPSRTLYPSYSCNDSACLTENFFLPHFCWNVSVKVSLVSFIILPTMLSLFTLFLRMDNIFLKSFSTQMSRKIKLFTISTVFFLLIF